MPMRPGDPRNGARYRRAVAECLAASDLCHLCGHPGARTADHLISVRDWPPGVPGVNDPANLIPAHGMKGRIRNACPVCGLLCNQVRGARPLTTSPRSRDW
jgi:hypothetical protein